MFIFCFMKSRNLSGSPQSLSHLEGAGLYVFIAGLLVRGKYREKTVCASILWPFDEGGRIQGDHCIGLRLILETQKRSKEFSIISPKIVI